MSSSVLVAASACVALLMQAEPVLPTHYEAREPSYGECLVALADSGETGPFCRGVFKLSRRTGETTVVAPARFGTLVHELCHVTQAAQGRAVAEAECKAVRGRAGECFVGQGAPGMFDAEPLMTPRPGQEDAR